MSSEKLGNFLREVSNWQWDAFVQAEGDKKYTSNQAIIFALIRNCASGKLGAIQTSLNRLDGKLATPVKVEYPKVFYLFPHAALPQGDQRFGELMDVDGTKQTLVLGTTDDRLTTGGATGTDAPEPLATIPTPPEADSPERDLATMSLRETLSEMADYPRSLPMTIMQLAEQTEQWCRNAAAMPEEIPKVKSVVAASLLTMAANRNVNAITEVFDQIDGKLVETIKVLGEDIYITSYAKIAPQGAQPNADGVLQLEAPQITDLWAQKLGKEN